MAQRVDHVNYRMEDRLPAVDDQPAAGGNLPVLFDDILPLENEVEPPLVDIDGKVIPPFDCGSPVMAGKDEKDAKAFADAQKDEGADVLGEVRTSIEKMMAEAVDKERKAMTMFHGFRVHILPGAFMFDAVRMFAKFGWKKAEDLMEADLVVFLGGADVSPYLYQQKAMKGTSYNPERDKQEMKAFEDCQKLAIPSFGICRGLQFLHVCNSGELWQDVDSHAGTSHSIIDTRSEQILQVTSIHHQMVMPGVLTMEVLATTPQRITHHFTCDEMQVTFPKGKKMVRMGDQDVQFEDEAANVEPEIEAAWYPQTKALGVQGHPEIGTPVYQMWSMQKIADMFFELGIDNPRN